MVDRKNVRDGMALGAADYITKPFSLRELITTIHAQLDRKARINREIQDVCRQAEEDAARKIEEGLRDPVRRIRSEAEKLLTTDPMPIPPRFANMRKKSSQKQGGWNSAC